MSKYFSAGCKNEEAHVCDCCEINDGRPTLYWKEKEFDLCHDCLGSLYLEHTARIDKKEEFIVVRRRAINESLRDAVVDKSGGRCVLCLSTQDLQVDHIIPFSKGGKTTLDNLQALCKKCNLDKRDK